MSQRQILVLFFAVAVVILLLITGVYLLLNSTATQTEGMMGVPTTSNNSIFAFIAIAVAVIIAIAIVLYFLFPGAQKIKRTNQQETGDIYCARPEKNPQATTEPGAKENLKPFDVFLCYKKSSGKDYADHLKAGLEELGLHTFEDCKDIPLTVETQEGWASFRDKALQESKYFVLIMTPGFELSHEVIKEIGMARKQGDKVFVFFRHRSMGRKITVNLGNEVFDITMLEQVSFDSKEELLRLAHSILMKPRLT